MPTRHEYTLAMQNPEARFNDRELANGTTAMSKPGQPLVYSGQLACVYRVTSNGKDHAVRCFVREASDPEASEREERYRTMSDYLNIMRPPGFVGFEYLDRELLVGGARHPVVKMDWVEGLTLDRYVGANRNNAGRLRVLSTEWSELMGNLQHMHIAHNDLQHGNVIVTPAGSMRLVDYDGVFLSLFKGISSPELGHRNYQHPGRTARDYDEKVDNFPALVIHLSLMAVGSDPSLWDRFHNGDNLLFTKNDLANPGSTNLWSALAGIPDEEIHRLTAELERCCRLPVSQTPPLHDILGCKGGTGSSSSQPSRPGRLRLKTSVRRRLLSAVGDRGRPSTQSPPPTGLPKAEAASGSVRASARRGTPSQNRSTQMVANAPANPVQQPEISRSTTGRFRYVAGAVVICVIAVLLWEMGTLLRAESAADADTRRSGATNPSHAATSPGSGSVKDASAPTQRTASRVADADAVRSGTAPTGPPPNPQNLAAGVNGDGHIVLSWEAPAADSVAGYQILRRRPTQGEDTLLVYVADTGSTATTYTDTSVTAGVKHVYRVKAINSAGVGPRSNYVNPTP